MHGLAVLQHDIVGDVHDVVDGTHAHAPQALPHPLGGRGDLDIAHHPGRVPGAEVRVGRLYIQQFCQRTRRAALDRRVVEAQGGVEGGGSLPRQTDDAEAVWTVGGDLKLHHVVVGIDDGPDIVSGTDALLLEDKDAVRDAVGELPLFGAEVRQRADMLLFRVQSYGVVGVDVDQGSGDGMVCAAAIAAYRKTSAAQVLHLGDKSRFDRSEKLVARRNASRYRGLFRVNGLVVVEKRGRLYDGIGEIPLVQIQLAERAEHTVGEHTPQFAFLNFLAAGQKGFVQGHGDHVPLVDVPRAGDNLDRLLPAHVQLADPHVVGIGVAFHGLDAARHYVLYLCAQVLRDLHLGAGEGHGLGKILVIGVNGYKLAEPFPA